MEQQFSKIVPPQSVPSNGINRVECPMRHHTTPPAKDLTLGLLSSIFEIWRAGGGRGEGTAQCAVLGEEWEFVAPGGGQCVFYEISFKKNYV